MFTQNAGVLSSIQKVCLYIVCFIDGAGRPTLWAQYRSECRV